MHRFNSKSASFNTDFAVFRFLLSADFQCGAYPAYSECFALAVGTSPHRPPASRAGLLVEISFIQCYNILKGGDNMEIKESVIKAIDVIVPELLPDCDVKRLPTVCSPDEFKQRLKNADSDSVIIFADYILSQRNEFLQGVANIMVSEIAARIKNADTAYAIMDHTLAKTYPNIVSGNAVIFLDETRAEQYATQYNENNKNKVESVRLKNGEITDFFMTMTRFGIEFVEIEPTICKIRYKQKQLIETQFDSISKPIVNFTMLRFLQMQGRNDDVKVLRVLEQGMLTAIANATLACMGVTLNGHFEALLITDKRDGSKWIPCFTDTTEIQETYTTVPNIAKLLMTSRVVTTTFSELEKYVSLENVSGIVMNIGGFGMRINKQTCQKMIAALKEHNSEAN